ncbi:hypothetical protein DFJ74DRAFT_21038 [Hyaloraphidium curvatum]|nr:hypothetical protein DFJ74DRAFT_21038 [Hyaloraphidium curvatum]
MAADVPVESTALVPIDAADGKEAPAPLPTAAPARRRHVLLELGRNFVSYGGSLFGDPAMFSSLATALRVPGEFALATGKLVLVRFERVDGDPGADSDPGTQSHLETRFDAIARGYDLRRLDLITELMKDVQGRCAGPAGSPPESVAYIDAVEARLKEIASMPPQIPGWVKDFVVLPLISSGFAAMFYDGPWISCALALPLGYIQTVVKMAIDGANPVMTYLYEFLTASLVGLFAGIIVGSGTFAGKGLCFSTLGLAGVVWCIPGLPLVLSAMQLASGETGAGGSNLAAAILLVFFLGFGLEFGLRCTLIFGLPAPPDPNCVPADVSAWWYFLLFPIIGVLHCMALEVSWPRGYLIAIPPAGLAFLAWYALQLIPSVEKAGITGFGFVLMVSGISACLPAFAYARYTGRSAFPIVYLSFQFIVPGGLSLKAALSDFGSLAGFTGSAFAAKVLAGALGVTVGSFVAHALVWPRKPKVGAWEPLPYR